MAASEPSGACTDSKAAAANPAGCRICYEDGSGEELIEPCECSGSLGLIHASCLERWLSTWNSDRCEICKHDFAVERRNKPLPQSFCQWWRTRGVYGPQGVTGDAICLVVLTPLCLAATYLCGVGANAYARLGFWEGIGLGVLCFMLVATYFLWLFVTVRFHYKSWRQWCQRNQDVRLLIKCRAADDERSGKKPADSSSNNNNNDKDTATCDTNNNSSGNDGNDSGSEIQRYNRFTRLLLCFNLSLVRDDQPVYNVHQQTSFV